MRGGRAVELLVELLRVVPRVRTWNPQEGKLILTTEELKELPLLTRNVVAQLAKQTDLCGFRRPYLGNQKHAAKNAYIFDTARLWTLLRVYNNNPF